MTIKSHINSVDGPLEDLVFSALGSGVRRRILDLVRRSPGLTVLEIADGFEMSRFGVRKHLDTLVQAGLLTVERDGRAKRHYLNAVPIQTIYDRWLTKYSRRWAPVLTGLKYRLEGDKQDMSKHRHRYEIYIRATADKLWEALTDGAITRQYYYGSPVESSFEPGAPIIYKHHEDDSVTMISGEIVEAVPGTRLIHTFSFHNDDPPSTVRYEIEENDGTCKLTLVHEFDEINKTYRAVEDGWNPILSGLKTLLETGEPLNIRMSDG
ncbi:MAG: helix-turn-helix domain-containing protein [Rhodothermales bacterium]|nr:helix-turn-helix domain-containing protein [Rhodothermales bacterium]